MKEHTIDATNKSLGRLASEVAILLMGKDSPEFRKNVAPKKLVNVINASKMKIDPKKMDKKVYQRYSGYPGGRKERTMKDVVKKFGYGEIFKKAVHGMLPKNKLKAVMLKNLKISE